MQKRQEAVIHHGSIVIDQAYMGGENMAKKKRKAVKRKKVSRKKVAIISKDSISAKVLILEKSSPVYTVLSCNCKDVDILNDSTLKIHQGRESIIVRTSGAIKSVTKS